VKAQHAYSRTLRWQERSDAEAATILPQVLTDGDKAPADQRQILGDWCWARGVELAIEHNLPFKIHTGYYAGNDRMPVDRIRSGHLTPLLAKYLDCRFVLMHIAYPYSGELVALTKHYRNVYADLCWAWSIDPFSSADFVRRFLHAAPINKLFAFGGDTGWPTSAAAYAIQARRWLTRALQAEVDEGLLTEANAIAVASRVLHDNQMDVFNVEAKKRACLADAG
jgi:predicted TIM-barrel fold metal-dependent hydrolase